MAQSDPGGAAAPRPDAPLRLVSPPPVESVPRRWTGPAAALLERTPDRPGAAGPTVPVLGGPGTGKTSLLIDLAVARLRAGVDAESILILTQSAAAAQRVRAAVTAELLAGDGSVPATREPLVRTVHSYAFGVLRLRAAARGNPPPRLITEAEQDTILRELLRGEIEDGAGDWPARLRPALGLVGFARQLRDVMLRAAERGYGPEDIEALGRAENRPDWVAVGRFAARYEQIMLLRGSVGIEAPEAVDATLDAAELITAALDAFALDTDLAATERARIGHLLVDDAHLLDPHAARLVDTLAAGAGITVVAGDGDQQVFRFRGASADYLDTLAGRAGERTIVLADNHRSAVPIARIGAQIAARLPGLPAHRGPMATDQAPPGEVRVRVLPSTADEATEIADMLRRAHLADGVPWHRMAVVVRSVPAMLPTLRRGLLAAGVPVVTDGGELPLARRYGPGAMLTALRAITDPLFGADEALALISGPLGDGDPVVVRRLRRGLRRIDTAAGRDRDSAQALRDALLADAPPAGLTRVEAAPLQRARRVLAAGRAALAEGRSIEEVLWEVWQASGLERRWVATSHRGGPAGAQADRDLDGMITLFELAADYVDRLHGFRPAGFVDYVRDRELPTETRSRPGRGPDAVEVLSAHAAVGREWDVVAVAGVQEGAWPNLRPRGTLLGAEDMVDVMDGLGRVPGGRTAVLAADERRLFLVACTRARRRLLITAVDDAAHGEQVPSRLLEGLRDDRDDGNGPHGPAGDGPPGSGDGDAGPGPTDDPVPDGPEEPDVPETVPPTTEPTGRLLTSEALVGELRAVLTGEPDADPQAQARRARAAAQLARLAAAGVDGAHPDQWFGTAETSTDAPLWDGEEPVSLSPSTIEKLQECDLRWMLERAGGSDGATVTAVSGTLVHTLVQAVAEQLPDEEIDLQLRRIWDRVELGAQWYSRHELARHQAMVDAFRTWLSDTRHELTATGVEVDVDAILPAGEHGPAVRLRGRIDRLEVDPDGRPVIVDVKTARNPVSKADAAAHAQLAAYQVALAAGGVPGTDTEPGGGRLVFVAKADRRGAATERIQPPLDPGALEAWRAQIAGAAAATRGPEFTATVNDGCRHCPVRSSCPAQDEGRQVTG